MQDNISSCSSLQYIVSGLLSFICAFCFPSQALCYQPKEGNVSAILGPVVSRTEPRGTDLDQATPFLGAMGLMAIGDIGDKSSLEIGMFHMHRIFTVTHGERIFSERSQVVHISMGYRHWWASSFATSLSIYSAYPFGAPEIIANDFGASPPRTSLSEKTIYGADLAASVEFKEWGRYALMIDTRYSHAFEGQHHEATDHLSVLFGVRYFIQEKQVRPASEKR